MPPPTPVYLALGRAIRHFREREELGISQETLADRTGMDRTYVSGIERGERRPSFGKIVEIAAGLEIPLQDLIAEYERRLTE